MKEFVLLVRVPVTYTAEQARTVNPFWDNVLAKWKAGNVYVTSFIYPGESYLLSGIDRTGKKESIISENLRLVSNIIIRAENFEGAIGYAKEAPVLDYGGAIEIKEILNRLVNLAK